MNRVVTVAYSILRVLGDVISTRREIIELVDRVARFRTTARCGDVYVICDVACCVIGDMSSHDKLTLRYNETDYAELEIGGSAPRIISLRRTTSKTAKRLLREAEKCVDELEEELRELEAGLATLKQILLVLAITAGASNEW